MCVYNGDNSNIEKIKAIYPYVYYEIADVFCDGKKQGNAILSKFEILSSSSKVVQEPSKEKKDYSKEGRIYLEIEVCISDKVLKIGTTHLSYTDRFVETELKDKEVKRLINIIRKNKYGYIFAGDLNMTKTSKYIKNIEEHLRYYETENTWTTNPFSYNGFEERLLNWKLDYIFSTKDIIIKNIRVHKTIVSDHLPLIAEILLDQKECYESS